jgi:hypothetical protein
MEVSGQIDARAALLPRKQFPILISLETGTVSCTCRESNRDSKVFKRVA